MNSVEEYNEKIQSGEIITSRRVKRVYAGLIDEMNDPNSPYVFDEKKAARPIRFVEEFCCQSKGEWAGKPVKLELFQRAFIEALFGFIEKETGLRRFREALFYVARKNGKSTLMSALALYMLIADNEPGAEVYCVASKLDQSKIIFNETLNMVAQSPDLSFALKKRKTDLYFEHGMAKMEPLGRDRSGSMDGLNAHLAIIDELHSIKDRGVYESLKQSQSARRQPLLIMTTTAGTIRECIFDDMLKYAQGVADGTIDDPQFFPVLYELDEKAEWTDPKAWIKANPGLGTIKKKRDIAAKVKRATQSPRDLAGILIKDFNVIETTANTWLTFEALNNPETFNPEDFSGWYAVGGCDLSRTGDLTAAGVLILGPGEKRYLLEMFWIPEDRIQERVQKQKIPYDKWHDAGLIRYCKGNSINYSDVTRWFLEVTKKMRIIPQWIYYDAYSANYWVKEMEAQGFNMVKCYQGAKTLSGPMDKLESDLIAKKVNYNNNAITKWCLTNTATTEDRNGNILPVKVRDPKYKIDGVAVMLDCYVGLLDHYNELKRSIKK